MDIRTHGHIKTYTCSHRCLVHRSNGRAARAPLRGLAGILKVSALVHLLYKTASKRTFRNDAESPADISSVSVTCQV